MVSVPSAMTHSPAATAAPEPPEDPPGVIASSSPPHGFSVRPNQGLSVTAPSAPSSMFTVPATIAPARFRFATQAASSRAMRRS